MKKIVKLTESELTNMIEKTINEMKGQSKKVKPVKVVKLTESEFMNIVKRVINEDEKPNDQKLLDEACMTWKRWSSISTPEKIKRAKDWTKTITGTNYPYDMDVACKSKSANSVLSDGERKVLKGVTKLAWIK